MESVYEYICKISSKIEEKQDKIIMQTIQYIGGTQFREITFDRNKVIEALTDYVKKQENKSDFVEVVRCKNCNCSYISRDGKMRCSLRDDISIVEPSDFCSYGERIEN